MLCSSGHVAHTDLVCWPALVGGALAGMRDRLCPRPVIRARPGGSYKASHDAEFGVGDSYHVVRSGQDIFVAWEHLAGSGMWLLPAIAAGPCRWSGPIRAPDSGDVTEFWGGPRPAGSIKVRVDPSFSLCCSSSSTAQAGPRLRLLSSSLGSSSSSPPTRC